MRWFLSFIMMCLLTAQAEAICTTGSMPFIFANNQLADATQVNANFAQIQTGVGTTCAASGANNDITSLGGLTTPLAPSSGGTTSYVASPTTSTGTNAIAIAGTNPPFVLTPGNRVHFIAGGTNTAAATVTVSPTAVQNLFRRTQSGVASTQGGEIIAGNAYTIFYDGTEFVIANDMVIVGEMKDFAGATAPPGWVIADGSAISRTTFAGLFAVIGTTYGIGNGTTTYNIPDTRGRNLAGLDNYGTAAGAANRLTNVATGCGTAFTTLGVTCANASQSHTQIVLELAQHNHTDSGHVHGSGAASNQAGQWGTFGGGGTGWNGGSGNTASSNAVITNTGSSQPMPIVNPNLGVTKIIRF